MTSQDEHRRRLASLRRHLEQYERGELPPDVLLALAADLEIMQRRVWQAAVAARASEAA